MEKYLIQIDTQAFKNKPNGNDIAGIKSRTQKSQAKVITAEEFVKYIESGYSFSLGILEGGLGAKNWVEQQLFAVDIDNEKEDSPILTPKAAIEICKKNGIVPAIIYLTFSSTKEKVKYRLIFSFDEPVKDEMTRKIIMETLVSLFPQADNSCTNADRIFFGTNTKVKYFGRQNILSDFKNRFTAKKQQGGQNVIESTEGQSELEVLKRGFNFEKLLDVECGEVIRENDNNKTYKNCPICGHKDDFVYYKDTKTWYCFGANGNKGGSIIDYLESTREMSQNEAINYFKHKLWNVPSIITKAGKQNAPAKKLDFMSASELINENFPPILWTVNNLIPQGLTLLASKPKLGKSWFVLSIGLSVASGKDFIGFTTEQSDVLYLSLEDSKHRMKARLNKILDDAHPPDNLYLVTSAPSLENGLIETLENYIAKYPKIKLIIIDTLQKIRSGCRRGENAYSADYRELGILKSFADKHNICLLVVHHVRKAKIKDDDVFNSISGTNGIFGTVDTAFVMQKNAKESYECELHITGRDIEDDKYILFFDKNTCQWTCLGTYIHN